MSSGKIITGIAIGAVVALILIPKTRRIIVDAVGRMTDSIQDLANNAKDTLEKGTNDVVAKASRQVWQD